MTPDLATVHATLTDLDPGTGLTCWSLRALTGLSDTRLAAALHEGFHAGALISDDNRIVALPLTVNA